MIADTALPPAHRARSIPVCPCALRTSVKLTTQIDTELKKPPNIAVGSATA